MRQLSEYRLLDFWTGYRILAAAVAPSIVSVGVLPQSQNDRPLLSGFCDRGGLTLIQKDPPHANPKFNTGLVDALNAATETGKITLNPHGDNDAIQRISDKLAKIEPPNRAFLLRLYDYVDAYHGADNALMVRHFGISAYYFSKSGPLSKAEIIADIHAEHDRCAANPAIITDYTDYTDYFDAVSASISAVS